METRAAYRTRQKEELAKLLAAVSGRHLTVADTCALLRRRRKPVGTTTVYRQLEKMVEEGTVLKHVTDTAEPATFEFIGTADCHDPVGFHCKCERLIHVECEALRAAEEHVRRRHGFAINVRRPVFHRVCDGCASKAGAALGFRGALWYH